MFRPFASRSVLRHSCAALSAMLVAASACTTTALGQEIVVKNDNLPDNPKGPQSVGFLIYFNSGEEANSWLTAPCTGTIVAIDILWMASGTSAPISLENAITLYQPGTFPTHSDTPLGNDYPAPGTPAVLEGPVFDQGNGMYEFRFLDQNQSIPLSVPVTAGQTFCVSFEIGEDHSDAGPPYGSVPTVPIDLNGCTPNRNGIFAIPGGFLNFCLFSSGDFIIRVKMTCGPPTGACCVNGGCSLLTSTDCTAAGGVFRGPGTVCNSTACDGACCVPSTQQCATVSQATCAAFNGVFQGAGTNCTTFVCFPMGACCLESGACNAGPMSPAACQALGGTFAGHNTTCATANCTAPLGACCAGSVCAGVVTQAACNALGGTWAYPVNSCATAFACPYCPEDIVRDGSVDVNDLLGVISAWGPCNNCPGDIAPTPFGNNQVDVNDLLAVITNWGTCP